ncbi:Arc family DNA-binding protein [bacterium]|nr:Arc family DNA-binding protein [bacterium]
MAENRALNDKFMLRLPDGLRSRIRAVAERNCRSMNAEIVALLEERFPDKREPPSLDEIEEWQDYIFEAESQADFDNRLAWANAEIEPTGWKLRADLVDDDVQIVIVLDRRNEA